MADKPDKKPDAASPAPGGGKDGAKADGKAAGGGGLLAKTPVLLGGVMIIEAIVLFAGFKFLGASPKHAAADDVAAVGHEGEGKDGKGHGEKKGDKKVVEIQVVDFRATNKARGQALLFDVSIYVAVTTDHEEKVRKGIKDREALIKDRIGTIIRQSDPEKLGGVQEPGLETLRRQVKYQLDEIIGEGMIEDVLVPRCIPFRAEY